MNTVQHQYSFLPRNVSEINIFSPFFCVQMSAVGITENVKGDVKKFEIWYSGREEVYIIQVSSKSCTL